ncbi:highly divergent homeobox-like isoform X3 [Sinocyclocheilus anshuiensis]|uniref:highly divergent homeobox-like isoform X3 n=1 Tax=Sinocyclocheilus anshuiensis TaxID=1608454 RepID=UPI0007B8E8D3|nr:PREDICTED: highly divergent homeobox-like isoform X3 [Sinocyclocheilus anshuiensis]
MEKWLEKRSIHTMNLRSVFTAEQQRILERYYESGMTNQSKSCFQLILQCAQETKLDFSVVRTWVGNKRRKLSKADQNGAAAHALSHQHVSCASAGSVLTAEMGAMRSIQHGPPVTHLLPPQASSSSSSSSPSSSSPLSDVILTGIYASCFNAATHNRTGMKSLPTHSEIEPAAHDSANAAMHRTSIAAGIHRRAPIIPGSSALKCSQTLKPFTSRDSAGIAPSWAEQCRTSQRPSWPQTSPQKPAPVHRGPADAQIQHVFTRSDPAGRKTRPVEASEVFSIAMETADADDEYAREEELANMAQQMQCGKGCVDGGRSSSTASSSLIDSPGLTCALNPSNSALFGEKGSQTSSSSLSRTSSPSSFPLKLLSLTSSRIPCLKVTSNMSAPWLHSNSRKRTDRTQFSDRDLYTLKRYWDKGMTSLGSLCKEKISAAASELSVDTEIIKTWIGNRRRKYRLMGIEIPPPKGGPVAFPNQTDPHSPHILEDERLTPELGEASEHNGIVSLCLSDDGASDLYLKENDDVNDESDGSTSAKHVKIEIVEDDDDDDDILTTEMEQMQNLLEFKNEEVQFLENELRSQKQKFSKLKSFTRSLLIAVKNKDRKKQRELLASLPQKVNEDWDLGLENHSESGAEMPTIQKQSSVSEEEEDTDQMRL